MATLSQSQIAMYAAAAGLPNPKLWGAVGMAESGGRTDVVNSIGCVGIFQINQPVWVKSHPTWTQAWLKVPANNARAAKVVFDAQGLGAWEAYTNGAYEKYYGGTGTATGGGTATATQADSWWGDSAWGQGKDLWENSSTGQVLGALGKTGDWLSTPANWVRILYVIGGGAVVLVGLAMVIKDQELKVAAKTVLGPVGGAAKKAVKPK